MGLRRHARAVFVLFLFALFPSCRKAPPPPADPPAAESRVRLLRDVSFEVTPERIARGRYLAEGILQCFVCHSERDWTKPGAPPVAGREGAGAVWPGRPWLVAANLTPDIETGIGAWTDDMVARAIREGIGYDGRPLHPQMWSSSFRRLTDEDVESVVVFLRSRPAVSNALPRTRMPPDREPVVPAPPLALPVVREIPDQEARGAYLVYLADCQGCHTSWYTPRNPGFYGGGNLVEHGTGAVPPAYGRNITMAPSGIPYYDAALFREVMRTGRVKARELSPLMPWIAFRNMSDEDLDAIFAHLKALRPVPHLIGYTEPPTECAACGGRHPLGDRNRAPEWKPVPYAIKDMRAAAGEYRFEDGFTLVVEVAGDKLMLRAGGEPAAELFTDNGRHFFARDSPDVVEFVRDERGRVTHLLSTGNEAIRIR